MWTLLLTFQKYKASKYKKFYANKLDNLEATNKFLNTQKMPKLTQEGIENLNRSITNKEI